MKSFNGFQPKVSAPAEKLPAGTYVCKILGAKEIEYSWGNVLLFQFDIAEGDYKNYFTNLYNNSRLENNKFKGEFRLNVPKDDGTESDTWTLNKFNNCFGCIEESNPGYSWNWDERTLKDKMVAITFRNEEWAFDGNTGWSSRPFNMATVESARNGKVKLPKDKPLSEEKKKAAGIFIAYDEDIPSDDFDLPFN